MANVSEQLSGPSPQRLSTNRLQVVSSGDVADVFPLLLGHFTSTLALSPLFLAQATTTNQIQSHIATGHITHITTPSPEWLSSSSSDTR